MAAERVNPKVALQLKVEVGTTTGGAAKYSTKTVSDIRPTLSDDDLLSIGTGLANLQTHPLGSVMRRDINTIVEE